MINELTSDISYRPRATYLLALCCIMITSGTLMFTNLESYYGIKDAQGIPLLTRATVPFQHGFYTIPRIVHLSIIIILFLLIARPVEKVLGTYRFVLFTMICWLIYFVTHRLFEMQGHGFHPIIWSYSILLWYILMEAKFLKTRSSFQENYRLLKTVIIIMWSVAPIMMMFIPLHFTNNPDISMGECLWLGNIFHLMGLVVGLGGIFFFKSHIRQKLLSFARKEKFDVEKRDTAAFLFCLIIPLFLVSIVYY